MEDPWHKPAMDLPFIIDNDKKHWLAYGPFYNDMQDQCNLDCILANLRAKAPADVFHFVDRKQFGDGSCVLIDPDHNGTLELMDSMMGYIEDQGLLDHHAYDDMMTDAMTESWSLMPLGERLLLCLTSDVTLDQALREGTPDELAEALYDRVHEMQ
jgi:hypothetical protein